MHLLPLTILARRRSLAAAAAAALCGAVPAAAADLGVEWSVQEGSAGGAIGLTGLYVAPADAGVYHVVAAARADASKKGSAAVTVTGGAVVPAPITGDVVVSVDATTGTTPISPYVFGTAGAGFKGVATLWRSGGNRLTGWNWENGWSNAGSDWGPYSNDTLLRGDGTPGAAARDLFSGVFGRTGAWRSAALVTMPTIGYVSGAWSGNATPSAAPDVNTPAPPATTGAQAWKRSLPGRAGDPHHAQATAAFDAGDGFVYQDDFLAWVKATWPGHGEATPAPIFVCLDNEPDLWGSTHAEIRGKPPAQHVNVGYDELVQNNVAYAGAVKDVLGQGALVFGPVYSGWQGLAVNGNVQADGGASAPPAGYAWAAEHYLAGMASAGAAQGRRLLDVLDLHWYPEASGAGGRVVGNDGAAQDASMIRARVQAPRSLWDPSYLERSWIVNWGTNIPGCTWAGDASKCGLKLLPRVRDMIAKRYPGTRLAVTEWSYGREMDVSNAVASADVLGIFAREGVYAAATWSMSSSDGCLTAAFRAYLDYDGARGRFGDTYAPTTVADPSRPVDTELSGTARGDGTKIPTQTLERVTAYASFDAGVPGRVVLVAVNKDLTATLNAGFRVKAGAAFGRAEVYRVTGVNGGNGGCTGPARQADVTLAQTNAFNVALPPLSVTVLVLKP